MATPTGIEADAPGSGRGKRFFSRTVLYVVALLFSLFAALPFAWMLLTIFKTNNDLYKPINNPFIYNDPPTLSNLDLLWNDTNYRTFILNTFMIAIVVVLITVIVVVPAAYSLVRLSGKWGEGLGVMIFLVYLVPPTLLFIPLTGVVADLGLQNSKWSMALVYPTFTIPFCTWLMMGFLRGVPWEIEEQAMIDGYTRIGAIWRTVIPISLPGILTVVIFSFTLTLHEFVYSLAFVQSSSQKTVSVGVFTELIRGDVYF
ncbi:MAG: carbohydrate ABC transporter permease, partial [Chloroflexota bacterium]|nr:carbohydrate ABC transporter permease [Chloroflexota bacterium]